MRRLERGAAPPCAVEHPGFGRFTPVTSIVCLDCPADITTQDGVLRCAGCVGEAHDRCAGCGQWYPDNADCCDCDYCAWCEDPVPPDTSSPLAGGGAICAHCRDLSY